MMLKFYGIEKSHKAHVIGSFIRLLEKLGLCRVDDTEINQDIDNFLLGD